MLYYPFKQLFKLCFSRRNIKNRIDQLIVIKAKLYSVYCKKNKHCMGTRTLIAVNKRMIHYDSVSEACPLLLN